MSSGGQPFRPSRSAPTMPSDTGIGLSAEAESPVPHTPMMQVGSLAPSDRDVSLASVSPGSGEVLEARGLSANQMQAAVLRKRVETLQRENAKSRDEVHETMNKLTATMSKLNEEKVHNSTLSHRCSGLMNQLSETEAALRKAEEQASAERKSHRTTKEAIDRIGDQTRDKERELEELRELVRNERQRADRSVAELSSVAQAAAGNEGRGAEERHRTELNNLSQQMEKALDRLLEAEDDTALFVARSAVLSTATDLDAKLAGTVNLLNATIEAFQHFSKNLEEDSNRMLMGLMAENKELWGSVTRLQGDLDKANQDLQAATGRGAVVRKEELDFAQKQIQTLEESLKEAHRTIENQTAAQQEVESLVRRLSDENEVMRRQLEQLRAERERDRALLQEKEKVADEATFEMEQLRQEVSELKTSNGHYKSRIESLSEQLQTLQSNYSRELQTSVRAAQQERDTAVEETAKYKSDAEDLRARLESANRELEDRTAYFNNYKVTSEEKHQQFVRNLQDDLAHHRSMYERELDDLRRDLNIKSDEVYQSLKDLEAEKTERNAAETRLRAAEEELAGARERVEQLQAQISNAENRQRSLQDELDSGRDLRSELESKKQEIRGLEEKHQRITAQLQQTLDEERRRHDAQVKQLEKNWHETEAERQMLQDECRKHSARAADELAFRQAKERFEKDKENLMEENARLHRQYQDVLQQTVNLQSTITQLQNRNSEAAHYQAMVEDLQRRMAELPQLRNMIDECHREAIRDKDEIEKLRAQRDEMSAKLEYFLDVSSAAAAKDANKERLIRDAANQINRLRDTVNSRANSDERDVSQQLQLESRQNTPPRSHHHDASSYQHGDELEKQPWR